MQLAETVSYYMHEIHYCLLYKPFPKQQILDPFILKELAANNFKVDENGWKFSKRVENTLGKGEVARYKQFLLFLQCFRKTRTADT